MYEYKGKVKPEFLTRAITAYNEYKSDKKPYENRIIENEKYYRSSYAVKYDTEEGKVKPASSYIFSAIENKYADGIDNYPTVTFLERDEQGSDIAKLLSKVVPAELDICRYKTTYKQNLRRKIKSGASITGVFYDDSTQRINIMPVDILTFYSDMHIKNIQDSQFIFVVARIDNEVLKAEYPKAKELFTGDAEVTGFSGSYTLKGRTEVVDCYYKLPDKTVQMFKMVDDTIIEATEDMDGYENGLYSHGQYPFVVDVLYPIDDCPFGFGVIDVVKNPQEYIDELDGYILKNAAITSESRFLRKRGSGIPDDITDLKNKIIDVPVEVSDANIKEFKPQTISQTIVNHRETKKNDLKEIIGNRDFQQGGTNGGVTAASAITVLQSAGEKLSRAMSDDSYDAFKEIIMQAVELIRQFYTEARQYRVPNETGTVEYQDFDNSMLQEIDTTLNDYGLPEETIKSIEFDIDIIPQRENPFTKESNNQTMMMLWDKGVLARDNVMSGASQIIVKLMQFDGKEQLLSLLNDYKEQMQQEQMQMQQQMQQNPLISPPQADSFPTEGKPLGQDDELVALDTGQGGDDELVALDLNEMR